MIILCMCNRGGDAGANTVNSSGAPLEVAEGTKGELTEGGAEPVARRWLHKVEMWKHPKVNRGYKVEPLIAGVPDWFESP